MKEAILFYADLFDLLSTKMARDCVVINNKRYSLIVIEQLTENTRRVVRSPAHDEFEAENFIYITKTEVIELLRTEKVNLYNFGKGTLRLEATA